jgi:hypothetical protein
MSFEAQPRRALKRFSSTLTCFEALLGLVDDVNAALAANQLVVAVASTQGSTPECAT